MKSFHGHPAEGGQQGVVKTKSHVKASPSGGQCCHHLTGEEVHVEEDEGNDQIDVDLHRDICPDFSVREDKTEEN